MELWQQIIIGVSILLLAAVIGWAYYRRQRSRRLRRHFGPEYDRVVAEFGDRRQAESELAHREARIRKLRVRQLSLADRERFAAQWRLCQARFVDEPEAAIQEADLLVESIMRARGYPVETPGERIADVSAAYPRQAANYREANEVIGRYGRGHASTEDLRKGFIRFRELFDELLGGSHEELKRAS